MLTKTQGIVLRYTRFGDTSIIVNLFTASLGLQSYLVKGVRKTQKTSRMALFQPLTLLDLVTYHRETSQLQHLKEVKCSYIFRNIHGDVRRESLAYFITEILNRTIREVDDPLPLYQFLEQQLLALDQQQEALADFHLHFLVGYAQTLGFGAAVPDDLTAGFKTDIRLHATLLQLLKGDRDLGLTGDERREILTILLNFLRRHAGDFGQLKSLAVLRDLLA